MDQIEFSLEGILQTLGQTHRATKYDWKEVMDFIRENKIVTSRQVREHMQLPKGKQQIIYSWLERNVAGHANDDNTDIIWDDEENALIRLKVSGRVYYASLEAARVEQATRAAARQ